MVSLCIYNRQIQALLAVDEPEPGTEQEYDRGAKLADMFINDAEEAEEDVSLVIAPRKRRASVEENVSHNNIFVLYRVIIH